MISRRRVTIGLVVAVLLFVGTLVIRSRRQDRCLTLTFGQWEGLDVFVRQTPGLEPLPRRVRLLRKPADHEDGAFALERLPAVDSIFVFGTDTAYQSPSALWRIDGDSLTIISRNDWSFGVLIRLPQDGDIRRGHAELLWDMVFTDANGQPLRARAPVTATTISCEASRRAAPAASQEATRRRPQAAAHVT